LDFNYYNDWKFCNVPYRFAPFFASPDTLLGISFCTASSICLRLGLPGGNR